MLTIMLPCKHNAEQFIQLNGWPGSTRKASIFADFMKVICNLRFIQLQITCNILIEIQFQLKNDLHYPVRIKSLAIKNASELRRERLNSEVFLIANNSGSMLETSIKFSTHYKFFE